MVSPSLLSQLLNRCADKMQKCLLCKAFLGCMNSLSFVMHARKYVIEISRMLNTQCNLQILR